ncbi:MAG: 5-formyltetrahydrofolate cyclo-ligase [Pseudomonadota bacterium]|jgi:5-formyltetrahydrofolate cyclo-ligase|nr:MAG: 5-formyltetrahydrofolate cyclo-ligase [Pseudomonadota bacterium]
MAESLRDWEEIRRWRSARRRELLERRAAMSPRERRVRGAQARRHLLASARWDRHAVLGIYWPIRGEIDVLDIARDHIRAGGVAALPVVTRKDAAVEFWKWDPLARMERGFWNIPVPAVAEPVRPDVLIIPPVGFDPAGYRLGYGGGYYDRTLASMSPLPLRIALAYADAELPTIHPQPHDIPMSLVVTDEGVRATGEAGAPDARTDYRTG